MIAKILVIDDDDALRRVINRILVGANHQVVEAVDGLDGTKKFQSEKPDIVISDVLMPEQEGIETIRGIRATGAKVGIIVMSGGNEEADTYLKMARLLGADAILSKPFHRDELLKALDEVLRKQSLID